jgi:hypothetical protein
MTRSPRRIHDVLAVIEDFWTEVPDMSLGQLLDSVAGAAGVELRNMKDEDLLRGLYGKFDLGPMPVVEEPKQDDPEPTAQPKGRRTRRMRGAR